MAIDVCLIGPNTSSEQIMPDNAVDAVAAHPFELRLAGRNWVNEIKR